MLLDQMLKRFIQKGTLNVTDSKGKSYRYIGAESGPEVSIRFHDKQVERQILLNPEMGLGEAYMNGSLTIESPNKSIYDLLDICTQNWMIKKEHFSSTHKVISLMSRALSYVLQFSSLEKSKQNVAHHYDLNANFYKLFLDVDQQYSCAYFNDPNDSLETAQINKKHHIAKKLLLKPGQKVLDIGCGWGGMALTLAKEYDVEVCGLTLSKEQYLIATERAKQEGLSDRVKFYLRDYRNETNVYDRIVSVGMFEHVGLPQYQVFFNQCQNLLKKDGLMLLHSIGISSSPAPTNPWILKYIFPGGYCPSLSEVIPKVEHANLYITDIEILRYHYAETLKNWRERFMRHWDKVKSIYNVTFCRMWEFYLASCETGFRNQNLMVFQIQCARDKSVVPIVRNYLYCNESNESNEYSFQSATNVSMHAL